MAVFVSPISIRALLQDAKMSPYEEANDVLNKFALNRAYYVGMQSTQPAALPVPLEGDPLHLAGKPPSQHGFQHILA